MPGWAFKALEDGSERPPFLGDARADSKSPATVKSPQTSKYEPLREYLEGQTGQQVTLSFEKASEVLGFPLPSSAHKYQAFWANQTDTTQRPWARAWQEAGFDVDSYRLSEIDGWVRFKRRA